MSVLVFTGTRPEIIKMAPIINELEKRGIEFIYVHTGQHYDYDMSKRFIEKLGLPNPHIEFMLENSSPAAQIGEIMIKVEKALESLKRKPIVTLVQGDTNSVLATALASLRLGMKVGHVEAGLRSYDWRMPEEHNRRMVDHISDYLFAPTELARRNLEEEKVLGQIYVTGNTVIDSLEIYFDKVLEVERVVLEQLKFDEYALVTFHRAENVDDPKNLKNFIEILRRSPIPIVYPLHPRTRRRLEEYGLLTMLNNMSHVQITPPQGYFEFLALLKNSRLVMTDSGGVQEEATHPRIKKPVLVLRSSTERPEAVRAGFARVVGLNPSVVLAELEKVISHPPELPSESPFGDGRAAERIVSVIEKEVA
ncbi:MAG: UDP-N-acetylglucosamine 2-epimerase (non-hydrolyzing) [Desulfurococcaceae archaeon]